MKQLFIGLIAEGTTDVRFLKGVIFKSIQELSWQCDNQVEIFDIRGITAEGYGFVEKMLEASKKAWQDYGISALCVHADSDARSIDVVMQNKFEPFFSALKDMPEHGAYEIARKLKAMGLAVTDIIKATGMTADEIDGL